MCLCVCVSVCLCVCVSVCLCVHVRVHMSGFLLFVGEGGSIGVSCFSVLWAERVIWGLEVLEV